MKYSSSLFLILGVSLNIIAREVNGVDNFDIWKDFKTKFNKTYGTEEEEQRRMSVFLDNKEYVESINTKSGSSFRQGINPLSDLTTEEINRSRNGFRLENVTDRFYTATLIDNLLYALNTTLEENNTNRAWYEDMLSPTSLDYRTQGIVSRVKDQGSCGSCWSFATTGAIESILASRGRATLLSEQNLVDCSRRYGNHGCAGGLMDAALRYVRDFGIMASHEYPYTARDESCKFRRSRSVTNVRGSIILPGANEALLRLVLSLTGPIPIAIDASAKSFHNYKSGVYDDRVCKSSPNSLNHAVLLVGYGTEKNGGDYWLVKNSWGQKWGDNGYIKIARNRKNLCGVATYAVLPLP